MKKILFGLTVIGISLLICSDSDWDEIENNSAFDKMKIKNRSKKTYEDKVYRYISGDFKVKNNNIELANVYLDNKSKNDNIEINIITEDLTVEGDSYKDSLDIKQNKYKNFVQNDEKGMDFFEEETENKQTEEKYSELGSNSVQVEDSRYVKVANEDVSELENIDIRGKSKIREVNVFIEDVNIMVD